MYDDTNILLCVVAWKNTYYNKVFPHYTNPDGTNGMMHHDSFHPTDTATTTTTRNMTNASSHQNKNNNIVYIHQQRCNGHVSNPYEYYHRIQQHPSNDDDTDDDVDVSHCSSWKQFRNVLWQPSNTMTIHPSSSSTVSRTNTIITTHMDLFHNNTNTNTTDQFLITTNRHTPNFFNLYDGPNHGTGSIGNHNTIAIYNLWDDHAQQQQPQPQPQPQLGQRRRHNNNNNSNTGIEDSQPTRWEFRPIQETAFSTTTAATNNNNNNTAPSRNSQNRNQNHHTSSATTTPQHHIVSGLQWYPMDTGTFITSTRSNGGYITLWDTNHMIPVLNCQPYLHIQSDSSSTTTVETTGMYPRTSYGRPRRGSSYNIGQRRRGYEEQLSSASTSRSSSNSTSRSRSSTTSINSGSGICTMHIGTPQPYLVATGSHRSDMTKIVDLRSGSTSHTIMIGTNTSFIYDRDGTNATTSRGSTASNTKNNRCVTSVQWSPIQSNTLATCTNGNCYLWDIRSTVQPIAICGNANPNVNRDYDVSYACHSIDTYLSQHRKRSNKVQNGSPMSSRTSTQPQPHQQIAGHDIYETLQFDHTGQYLITLSHKRKQPNETFLNVFDLLSPAMSPDHTVPIYPSSKTLYSYTETRDRHRPDAAQPSILFVTGHKPSEEKIWVSSIGSDAVSVFQMLQDPTLDHEVDDVDDHDEFVIDALVGHMGHIRCGAVMTGPNRIRQRQRSTPNTTSTNNSRHLYAPYTIVTAAEDGVILVWEQQQKLKESNHTNNTNEDRNKRQRLSVNQQLQEPSSTTGDFDTW